MERILGQAFGEDFIRNETFNLYYFPHPGSRKKNALFSVQIQQCLKV